LTGCFPQSQFGQRVAQATAEREAAMENSRIACVARRRTRFGNAACRHGSDGVSHRGRNLTKSPKASVARKTPKSALEDTLVQGRDHLSDAPDLRAVDGRSRAFAILDRRSVLLSLGSIDVTDDAIARIDARLGTADATQKQVLI
jgi:hypothetical protein